MTVVVLVLGEGKHVLELTETGRPAGLVQGRITAIGESLLKKASGKVHFPLSQAEPLDSHCS